MHVNQLAHSLKVSTDTVRFYTKIAFLRPVKSAVNGYKVYDESDRQRLRFIVSARQLGFSVGDIGQILEQADQGLSPCPLVRRLIDQRLQETEQRYQQTARLRERMRAAVQEWSLRPHSVPDGHSLCRLIEDFMQYPD
jgi:DNA-binding transcriptional MerR regulator